jgi:hypothetical protein
MRLSPGIGDLVLLLVVPFLGHWDKYEATPMRFEHECGNPGAIPGQK